MLTTERPQAPIKFVCCDGETHIATKIRQMERHINERGRHWAGTADDFESWAYTSMDCLLQTLRQHLLFVPKETTP